jgi:hypothetical protein
MAEVFVTEGSPPTRDLPRWGCRGTSESDLHASGGGGSSWMIVPQSIAPDRLRLVLID